MIIIISSILLDGDKSEDFFRVIFLSYSFKTSSSESTTAEKLQEYFFFENIFYKLV